MYNQKFYQRPVNIHSFSIGGEDYIEFPSDYDPSTDETGTTMSLVTGRVRTHQDMEDLSSSDDKEIALRNEKTDLAVFGSNTSG